MFFCYFLIIKDREKELLCQARLCAAVVMRKKKKKKRGSSREKCPCKKR